jgi:hypothetical protein
MGILLFGVEQGLGRHTIDLPPMGIRNALKSFFFLELFYVVISAMIKLAFCMTLVRIMIHHSYVYPLYALMAIIIIFGVFVFFWVIFICKPVSFFWESVFNPYGGTCKDLHAIVAVTHAHSAVMAFADVSLAIIAGLMVMPLHMDRRTKITVFCLLAFGSM